MKQISFVITAILFSITTACTTQEKPESPDTYKVVKPIIRDTVYTHEYIAEIHALQNVELRSRIAGFVEKNIADEGQSVKEGQVLFIISGRKYQQELLKAEAATKSAMAELKSAEIELENTQRLFDKNIISKSELELSKAKIEMRKASVIEAEANEAQAELNLSYTKVQAPFAGIINRIPNKTGSLVEEGTLLTSISDSKDMLAYFNISEKDYIDYLKTKDKKESKEVALVLVNGDEYDHLGAVETVESEFDKSTGNIAFRAKFPNPKGILKHGSSGKIIEKKYINKALIIPQKSTFEIQDKLYVFVLNKNNELEQRNIIPQMRLPHVYILESGLSPEETILFEGIQHVRAGDKIIPDFVSNWLLNINQ